MKKLLLSTILLLSVIAVKAQASLTIENNSQRTLTVKVMQRFEGKVSLYETVTIGAFGNQTTYFSESGSFFTKSKAVMNGKNPVYRKGKPFRVTNDAEGYSVMTITFSITESSIPQATGGISISKSEFDQN